MTFLLYKWRKIGILAIKRYTFSMVMVSISWFRIKRKFAKPNQHTSRIPVAQRAYVRGDISTLKITKNTVKFIVQSVVIAESFHACGRRITSELCYMRYATLRFCPVGTFGIAIAINAGTTLRREKCTTPLWLVSIFLFFAWHFCGLEQFQICDKLSLLPASY